MVRALRGAAATARAGDGDQGKSGDICGRTRTQGGEDAGSRARAVVVATGYFGSPNRIGVPGEDLRTCRHVYHEGHEAFHQDAVVVGGGNSAAEAALDLWRSGARVTLVHFGPTFDKKIKPWVLPDFTNRVKEGVIAARWNSARRVDRAEHVVIRTTERARSGCRRERVYADDGLCAERRSAARERSADRCQDGHSRAQSGDPRDLGARHCSSLA